MKEYQKPEIKRETLSAMDVIAVSNGNSEILDVHLIDVTKIFTHKWKDSWN